MPLHATRAALLTVLLACAPLPAAAAWTDQPGSVIADMVSHVLKSVVHIVVVHPAGQPNPIDPKLAQADEQEMTSGGSGFVIDSRGLVATNKHVVENAEAVFVGTPDGGRYRASIVGVTGKADIALLRISPKANLPAVAFGDSDKLRIGDTVVAIGSPFGFENSVTAGIVSSTNRNIMESPFDDYIQTDAAINHGNSGGPLFNLRGEVVGMNSVLVAPGKYTGSAGIGFAIPSNDLRFVYDRMEKYNGQVRAGMLPIKTQQVTALLAQAMGAPEADGAMVVELEAQSDSMNGAIQAGDIILTFNGEPVLDPRDLARHAAAAAIGSNAHLDLYRAGEKLAVDVPIQPLDTADRPAHEPEPPPHILGLHFGETNEHQPGVQVSAIDRNGSAADSGLHRGDIVLEVQQQAVNSPAEAEQAIKARMASGQHFVALLIQRGDQRSWFPVALPK